MQHIPKVRDKARRLPNVPYFEHTGIGHGDISQDALQPPVKSSPTDDAAWSKRYSSYRQHSLYFGTLRDFFAVWQIPVNPGHFITTAQDGTSIITTALFNEYIVAAVIQEHKLNPWCLLDVRLTVNLRKSFVRNIEPRVRSIHMILSHLQHELREIDRKVDALHPLVWDSLVILGGTLDTLAESLYRICTDATGRRMYRSVSFDEFHFRYVHDITIDASWCPRERGIVSAMTGSNPLTRAFIGQIQVHQAPEQHRECDESRCRAYTLDSQNYPELHDAGQCDGSCQRVGYDDDDNPSGRQAIDTDEDLQSGTGDTEQSQIESPNGTEPGSTPRDALHATDLEGKALWTSKITGKPHSRLLTKSRFRNGNNISTKANEGGEPTSSMAEGGSAGALAETSSHENGPNRQGDKLQDLSDDSISSDEEYDEGSVTTQTSHLRQRSSTKPQEQHQQQQADVADSDSIDDVLLATVSSDSEQESLSSIPSKEADAASEVYEISNGSGSDERYGTEGFSPSRGLKLRRYTSRPMQFVQTAKKIHVPARFQRPSQLVVPRKDYIAALLGPQAEMPGVNVEESDPPALGQRVELYLDPSHRMLAAPQEMGILSPWRNIMKGVKDDQHDRLGETRNASDSKRASSSEPTAAALSSRSDGVKKYFALQSKHDVWAVTFDSGALRTIKVPVVKKSPSKWVPEKGRKLVAISHVWKDGLGNPSGNTLPACQIARLQRLANALYPGGPHPIPFYVDTLMIPFSRPHPSPEQKRQKELALADMEWTYKFASRVLVLDSGLMQVPSAGLKAEELAAHVLCSHWTRRLWTLQEGRSRTKAWYQFQDGAVQFGRLRKESKVQSPKFSSWSQHSRLVEGDSLRQKQKMSFFLDPRGAGHARLLQQNDVMNKLDPLSYDTLTPVGATVFGFVTSTMNIHVGIELPDGYMRSVKIAQYMQAMYYRDLTEHADEPLVLSSLVHSNPGSAARLHSIPSEDRFKEFWLSLVYIPQNIIFLDQQRYTQFGCGWMPKTLLSTQWPASRPLRPGRLARRTKNGLLISAFGLLLPEPCKVPTVFCIEYLRRADPFKADDELYQYDIHLRQPGGDVPVSPSSDTSWAIIPENKFWERPEHCHALLVGLVQDTEGRVGLGRKLKRVIDEQSAHLKIQSTVFEAFVDMIRIDAAISTVASSRPCYHAEQAEWRSWIVG